MRHLIRTFTILCLLVVGAGTASADWLKFCSGSAVATSVGSGEWVCHNPASADDDPGLLSVMNCENWDAGWYDNITGDGSGDTDGTAAAYTCPFVASTATDTEAERLLACQPLNGGTTLNATSTEIFGGGLIKLWFDVEAASTENQLIVRCSQPARGE